MDSRDGDERPVRIELGSIDVSHERVGRLVKVDDPRIKLCAKARRRAIWSAFVPAQIKSRREEERTRGSRYPRRQSRQMTGALDLAERRPSPRTPRA
jgi:hypothetical protein